jgi:hypothetical protein
MSVGVWLSCTHFFYVGDTIVIEGSSCGVGASCDVFGVLVGFVTTRAFVLDGLVPT